MNQSKTAYILDTSALLTYIEDEDGSDFVDDILAKAETQEVDVYIAFISLTELFYITAREKDETEAIRRLKLVRSLAVEFVESYEELNLAAARIKSKNRLSLADSYIAALSMEHGGVLVHKDPEFENVKPSLQEFRLPYKPVNK